MKTKITALLLLLFISISHAQDDIPYVDGFDYPIGDRGYDKNENKVPIPEQLIDYGGETNLLYPSTEKYIESEGKPDRCSASIGDNNACPTEHINDGVWKNAGDVGNSYFICGSYKIHSGEDWNIQGGRDIGEDVYSVANGKIIYIGETSTSIGGRIVIKHKLPYLTNNGNKYIYSYYEHIKPIDKLRTGDIVSKGDKISTIASTTKFDSHLHFQMQYKFYNTSSKEYYNDINENDPINLVENTSCGYYDYDGSRGEGIKYPYDYMIKSPQIIDPSDFIDANRGLNVNLNDGEKICLGGSFAYNDVNFYFKFEEGKIQSIENVKINESTIEGTFIPIYEKYSTSLPEGIGITDNEILEELLNSHEGRYRFQIAPEHIENLSLEDNKEYSISFQVNTKDGETIDFKRENGVYTIVPNRLDSAFSEYYAYELETSLHLGLFKGASLGDIEWNEELTRAEASKILVVLAIELGYLNGINLSNSKYYYNDITTSDWVHPYVSTLINSGIFTGAITDTGNSYFLPNESVTLEEFSKWAVQLFDIEMENNKSDAIETYFYSEYMNVLKSITYEVPNNSFFKYLISNTKKYVFHDGIFNEIANGKYLSMSPDIINKKIATKILAGIYLNKSQNNYSKKTTNSYDWSTAGSILNTGNIGPDIPSVTSQEKKILYENEVWLTNELPKTDKEGNPLLYYWAIKGGLIKSTNIYFNQIRYTAPDVDVSTDFELYIYSYNNQGNFKEAILPITILPEDEPEEEFDFYFTDLEVSLKSASAGEQVNLFVNHCFNGSALEKDLPSVKVTTYLSKDKKLDEDDFSLTVSISSLGVDDPCEKETTSFKVDSNIEAGDYYILFVSDEDGTFFNETDTSNNIVAESITILDSNIGNEYDFSINDFSLQSNELAFGVFTYLDLEICYEGNENLEDIDTEVSLYLTTSSDKLDINDAIHLGSHKITIDKDSECVSNQIKIELKEEIDDKLYYLHAIINNNGIDDEIDKDNNSYFQYIYVVNQGVRDYDFYPLNPSLSSSNVTTGEEIDLYVEQCYTDNDVTNNINYFNSNMTYFISETKDFNNDSAILLSSDSFLITSKNTCNNESEKVTIPKNLKTGTYYILFYANYDEEYKETSTNQGNNIMSLEIEVTNIQPDLIVDHLEIKTQVSEDAAVDFEVKIKNDGGGNSASSKGILYWSAESEFDETAKRINESFDIWEEIESGQSVVKTIKGIMPSDIDNGFVYFYYVVDLENEINEENNMGSDSFYYEKGQLPDLQVKFTETPTLNEDNEVSFKIQVENIGYSEAISSKGKLYWSSSETLDESANEIGSVIDFIDLIPLQGTSHILITETIPAEAVEKTLYIYYKVDYQNLIKENDELNNIASYLLQTIDNDAPIPSLTNLETVTSSCGINEILSPTAIDDVDGEIEGVTDLLFPLEESTIITWKYEDTSGNISEQFQEVIIEDKNITVTQEGTVLNVYLEGNNSYQWIDCSINEDIIGETKAYYTAKNSGNYAVRLKTEDNCVHLSECFNISQLSINDDFYIDKYTIYPNPVKDYLVIKPNEINGEKIEIKIYSIQGRLIKNISSANRGDIKIDFSDFKSSIYFISINSSFMYKIIKEDRD